MESEHLAGPQPGLVAEELRQVPDPPARLAVAERPAQDMAGPTGRAGQPEQDHRDADDPLMRRRRLDEDVLEQTTTGRATFH